MVPFTHDGREPASGLVEGGIKTEVLVSAKKTKPTPPYEENKSENFLFQTVAVWGWE